jgi:hypothetical protein
LACGVLIATVTIVAGPKHTVVCTDTGWPNSAFGDMFGHVDAESFTGCDVPTLGTWVLAVALLVAPVVLLALRYRSRT